MNRQKGFILPIILIALATIAGIGLIVLKNPQLIVKQKSIITPISTSSPSSNPESNSTANWKTYINPTYHYQLSYPQNWNVGISDAGDSKVEITSFDKQSKYIVEDKNGIFRIDVWDNLGDKTLGEWLLKNGFKIVENTKINDIPAIKVGVKFDTILRGNQTNYVLTGLNKELVVISLFYGKGSENTVDQTLKQILSTFQFVVPTPTPTRIPNPTTPKYNYAGWKTEILSKINGDTAIFGPHKYNFIAKIPDGWSVSKNGSLFIIQDSNKYLSLNASGFSGDLNTVLDWPKDSVFVSQPDMLTADGGPFYIVRYYDLSKSQYVYSNASAGSQERSFDPKIDKVSNWLYLGEAKSNYESFFQAWEVVAKYQGPEPEKDKLLKLADQVVASFVLN